MGVTRLVLASRCALNISTPVTRFYAVFSPTRRSQKHAGALLRHLKTEGVCALMASSSSATGWLQKSYFQFLA